MVVWMPRVVVAGLAVAALWAGRVEGQHAQRVEVHAVSTVDLTAAQVLAGMVEGRARTIAGELRLPFTEALRVPAVILLHGDGGALSNQPLWADELNAAGHAVFTLDSFSARGLVSRDLGVLIEGSSQVSSLGRVVDAYRALELLARHPRIDAQRIAVLGFSSGGRTALLAAMRRFAAPHLGGGQPQFAAHIALYPPCNVRLLGDTDVLSAPLRIHHGTGDVITRATFCREYVEELRAAGRDVQFIDHADARHGFDASPRMRPPGMPDVPNFSACRLSEVRPGEIVNRDTGEPFKPADACVASGLAGGPDPRAAAEARTAVIQLLRQLSH